METLKVIDINPDGAKKLAQRLHRKKDEITLIRKTYIAEKSEAHPDERAITAYVSTPDRDRDGEIVDVKGIDTEDYQKNAVLLWAHQYSTPPIGKCMWPPKKTDKGLLCKFQFANTQFADEIYSLYRDGFLKTFSIGFIPLDFDSIEKVHKKISLLEVSAVPVPSNPNAKVEAMQKGLITCEQLKKDMGIEEAENKVDVSTIMVPISADIKVGVQAEMEVDGKKIGKVFFPIEAAEAEESKAEVITKPETTPDDAETKEAPDVQALFDHVNERLDGLTQTLEALKPLLTPAPVVAPALDIIIDPPADVLTLDPTPKAIASNIASTQSKPQSNDLNPDEVEAAITSAVKRLDMTKQINEGITLALDRLKGRVR